MLQQFDNVFNRDSSNRNSIDRPTDRPTVRRFSGKEHTSFNVPTLFVDVYNMRNRFVCANVCTVNAHYFHSSSFHDQSLTVMCMYCAARFRFAPAFAFCNVRIY